MKVTLEYQAKLTPKNLAEALNDGTADEFAEFWFCFSNIYKEDKLREFAKAMSPKTGSNRKKPLKELLKIINHYEVLEELAK